MTETMRSPPPTNRNIFSEQEQYYETVEAEVADILFGMRNASSASNPISLIEGLPRSWSAKRKRSVPPDSPPLPLSDAPAPGSGKYCTGSAAAAAASPSTPIGLSFSPSDTTSHSKQKSMHLAFGDFTKMKDKLQQIQFDVTQKNEILSKEIRDISLFRDQLVAENHQLKALKLQRTCKTKDDLPDLGLGDCELSLSLARETSAPPLANTYLAVARGGSQSAACYPYQPPSIFNAMARV
ncbi:hypothetical protein Dimus_028074 [Dionaea muscipula]